MTLIYKSDLSPEKAVFCRSRDCGFQLVNYDHGKVMEHEISTGRTHFINIFEFHPSVSQALLSLRDTQRWPEIRADVRERLTRIATERQLR